MKFLITNIFYLILFLIAIFRPVLAQEKKNITLKDAYKDYFLIGTALNTTQLLELNPKVTNTISNNFNSIVAENCMKSMYLQPREGEFNFKEADKFVEFGEKHGMQIIGHTLIWHSQAPHWFFTDKNGNDVSKEVLIERMRNHINTVVSRYRGRIKGWDVVNEAILDNGEWRKSKFYEIIGEDYFKLAFEFAHKADPNAELYYNDYNTAIESKRNGIASKIKHLLDLGVKVDGLGMQEHHGLNFPSLSEVEATIQKFSSLRLKVMVTELDINILPNERKMMTADINEREKYKKELNPYINGLPEEVSIQLGNRYIDLFKLYLKYADKISRVTLWGVSDKDSWLNNFPIQGRTNYPLLFDRNYDPKPFVQDILNLPSNK